MGFNLGMFLSKYLRLLTPITAWMYRSEWHRRFTVRIMLLFGIAPIVGYFRRPFVKREFQSRIQSQIQTQQQQMKQSLQQIELNLEDNISEYLIVFRCPPEKKTEEDVFKKQKTLFEFNNEVLEKLQNNQNYFEDVSFVFLGDQDVYNGLEKNLNPEQNNFTFLKQEKPKFNETDKIFLIAREDSGERKIIMEWELGANLKAILRQISKHKHKKFLQSMNF